MTEPKLPPGMKAGPEIVRIIATVSEPGQLMGISVLGSAPCGVIVAAMKLAITQLEKLPPNASGTIIVKETKPDDELKKARLN